MMMDKNDEVVEQQVIDPITSSTDSTNVKRSKTHQNLLKRIEKWGLDVIEKDISIALFYLYF